MKLPVKSILASIAIGFLIPRIGLSADFYGNYTTDKKKINLEHAERVNLKDVIHSPDNVCYAVIDYNPALHTPNDTTLVGADQGFKNAIMHFVSKFHRFVDVDVKSVDDDHLIQTKKLTPALQVVSIKLRPDTSSHDKQAMEVYIKADPLLASNLKVDAQDGKITCS